LIDRLHDIQRARHRRHLVFFQLEPTDDIPVHRVEEDSDLTITVETPTDSTISLVKDGQPVNVSDHIKINAISPTKTELELIKVKPADEGLYHILVNDATQPLMKLEVNPKGVVRQVMQLPKTQFNAKETLTIVCQFDATPEEPFIFLHNEQVIVPDSRISTTVEDNKYTIVVKDLRPGEDEGVYTLQSEHLILDTPSISVVPDDTQTQPETINVAQQDEIENDARRNDKEATDKPDEQKVGYRRLFSHTSDTNRVRCLVRQNRSTADTRGGRNCHSHIDSSIAR
jgi:hypothetical protein